MKSTISFSLLLFSLYIMQTGCFKDNRDDFTDPVRHREGELIVRIASGYNYQDLLAILDELDLVRDRSIGSDHVVLVPDDAEVLWILRLQEEPEISNAQLNRYGFDYKQVIDERTPYLQGDTLFTKLEYSGCNANHEFDFEYDQVGQNSYDIWLFKETPDEACDMLIQEEHSFYVPGRVLNSASLILYDPNRNEVILK